ncbi:hypothetical protein AB4Y88_08320 [Paenarthrobacter sp. RAF9]
MDHKKEQKQVTPYDLKVSRVCVTCNGGWMRQMDEAIKDLISDLAWGRSEGVPADRVEQLATWCTKVALMRSHRDRRREQETPLILTHRFYKERAALGPDSVQVGKIMDSGSAISGNVSRQLRTIGASGSLPADGQIDSVNLVTFQIGQFFFHVGLSTGSEWSRRENARLLKAGRLNRADSVKTLKPGCEVSLKHGLTQEEFIDNIGIVRLTSRISTGRDNNMIRQLMAERARVAPSTP